MNLRNTPYRDGSLPPFLSALVAALICLFSVSSFAACDIAHFGEHASHTCSRASDDCIPAYLPEEIGRIAEGAIIESVGLAVNDGRATWRALDIDRRELVIVERYAGRKIGQAPHVITPTAHEYLKTIMQGDVHWIDHVRRYPLSADKVTELACAAAAAWSQQPVRFTAMPDVSGRFYLLRADTARVDSGVGTPAGLAAAIARNMDNIVKRKH